MATTPSRSPASKQRRIIVDTHADGVEDESPNGKHEVERMLLGTPRRRSAAHSLSIADITPTKLSFHQSHSTSTQLKENVPLMDAACNTADACADPIGLAEVAPSLPTPTSTPTTDRVVARPIKDIYSHALQLLSPNGFLHSPNSSASLPILGRESQRTTMIEFLARRFPSVYPRVGSSAGSSPSSPPSSLYVSGPPGIGKTALVSSVLAEFTSLIEEQELDDGIKIHMQTCQTSGMGQAGVWEQLGEGLGMNMNLGKGQARLTAKQAFEKQLHNGCRYLIILDEIDHLQTGTTAGKNGPLQALLTIAHAPGSPLTLIGIANTLDLMSKFDSNKTSPVPVPSWKKNKGKAADTSAPATQQLHFKAYSASEIEAIVRQRLSLLVDSYPHVVDLASPAIASSRTELALFHPAALKLCAMKVAARSGDIRQAFRVLEVCVSTMKKNALGSSTTKKITQETMDRISALTPSTTPKASPSDMNLALKNAGLSVSVELASQLAGLQRNARFVLVSICIALSRGSLAGFEAKALNRSATVSQCYAVYQEMIELDDVMRRTANLSRGDWVDAQGLAEASAFIRTIKSSTGAIKGRRTKGLARTGIDAADPMIALSSYGLDEIAEALKTVPAAEGMSAGVLEDTLRISKSMLHWEEGRVLRERNNLTAEQQTERARNKLAPSEGFHGIGLEKGPAQVFASNSRSIARTGTSRGKGTWIGKKRRHEDIDDEGELEAGLEVVDAEAGKDDDDLA